MDSTVAIWIIGLVSTLVEGAVATIIGLWIRKKWDANIKERKELEDLREQNRIAADNKRCEDMKASIHEEFKPVIADMDLMKKSMQKDIRRSLRQDAALYIKRGWATHQEKTEYDELYWCYHNLGKNGVVDNDHKRVMELSEESKGE